MTSLQTQIWPILTEFKTQQAKKLRRGKVRFTPLLRMQSFHIGLTDLPSAPAKPQAERVPEQEGNSGPLSGPQQAPARHPELGDTCSAGTKLTLLPGFKRAH